MSESAFTKEELTSIRAKSVENQCHLILDPLLSWDLERLTDTSENHDAPYGAHPTLWGITRHVSRSGTQKVIDPFLIVNGDVRYLRGLADAAGHRIHHLHDGNIVNGYGMDALDDLWDSMARYVTAWALANGVPCPKNLFRAYTTRWL